jgi:hypothetical protein
VAVGYYGHGSRSNSIVDAYVDERSGSREKIGVDMKMIA